MSKTRREYETAEYAGMINRMIDAYGRRLADADPADLAQAVALAGHLEATIGRAVAAMREAHGYSYADLAAELGVTRQAAQQRFSRYSTGERVQAAS